MVNRLDVYPTNLLATHISWRINRMKPNRILRKLFPKPAEAPYWWSQGTEKFVFIDESKSPPYSLVQIQNCSCYYVSARYNNLYIEKDFSQIIKS